MEGLSDLGMTLDDAVACLAALSATDLAKSMTRHDNHRIWQDVYKPVFKGYDLYVKVQLLEGKAMVVSFKAR